MKLYFTKTPFGLIPNEPNAEKWFNKLKPTQVVGVEIKKVRNYQFMRKYFALLRIGFDNWTPPDIDTRFGKPEKNFDRFRSDVIILAGYYDTQFRLDGTYRIEPKSISFANMSEDNFNELYDRTIDVLLKYVYPKHVEAGELEKIVNKYLEFA